MAKKVGFEVVSTKPVCVDFRDGRSISFRPGQRFEATVTNSSVARLLRTRSVRKLGPFEQVPPTPVKLGAPKRVQNILRRRAEIEKARKAAIAKMESSKKAPPTPEPIIDLASPIKKMAFKPKPDAPREESRQAEDK